MIDLSMGTLTQSISDVENRIEKDINELVNVTQIAPDKIETILCQLSWNTDMFLQVSELHFKCISQ